MTNQAESWHRPAGWYDVGGGMSAYWNGQSWTGDQMPSVQRWPGPQPAPIVRPRGVPRLWGTPWFVWAALLVVVAFFALPLASSFFDGFFTGLTDGLSGQ